MTIEEVRQRLRRECERSGSQAAWAKANQLGAAYVSDVINGRRDPGARMLTALGLTRSLCYKEVKQ